MQKNQHQPLLRAISRALKPPGMPCQVESGEPFTADNNLRVESIVYIGGFRCAPIQEYRNKSILLFFIIADSQAQVYLLGSSAGNDGPAASTSKACKRQHIARAGHVSFDERSRKLAKFAGGKLWAPRGKIQPKIIDQLAASVVGGGVEGQWRGRGW